MKSRSRAADFFTCFGLVCRKFSKLRRTWLVWKCSEAFRYSLRAFAVSFVPYRVSQFYWVVEQDTLTDVMSFAEVQLAAHALHVFAESSPLSSSVVRMEFRRKVFHDGLEPLDASRLAQSMQNSLLVLKLFQAIASQKKSLLLPTSNFLQRT